MAIQSMLFHIYVHIWMAPIIHEIQRTICPVYMAYKYGIHMQRVTEIYNPETHKRQASTQAGRQKIQQDPAEREIPEQSRYIC